MLDLMKVRDAAKLLSSRDRDAFIASTFGVSKAHYLAWRNLDEEGFGVTRCAGKTKKGQQCRNPVYLPYEPAKWDGQPLFCALHGPK